MSAAAHPLPVVNANGRPSSAPAKPRRPENDGPVCASDPYPRITPGKYLMRCIETKCYRDPQFRRHVCRLAFSSPIVRDGVVVYSFINLGDGERCPGRRSRYWKVWTMANEAPPRRGQTMTARLFTGKWFMVEIADITHDAEKREHGKAEIYSTVREILELAHA
jgi:hypothetical protein